MMRMLSLVALSGALLGSACDSEDEVKIKEIESSLAAGMGRQEVESFFDDHDIEYGFVSREQAEMRSPPFPWKDPDAVGFYAGTIRNVRTRWWMLASEHITVRVEIDPNDRVSQVIVKREYTAP